MSAVPADGTALALVALMLRRLGTATLLAAALLTGCAGSLPRTIETPHAPSYAAADAKRFPTSTTAPAESEAEAVAVARPAPGADSLFAVRSSAPNTEAGAGAVTEARTMTLP